MPATVLPAQCTTALKEWASVLQAMARGEQLVLIRKGGLIEPGSGFDLLADTFVCYPTFEHQAVNYLRPPFRRYFEEASAQRAPEGQVRMALCGLVVSSTTSCDPALIERLSAHHIYNEDFLTQRLKWQPEQPLTIVVVRAFRLLPPLTLPVSPHYTGCKSWVELDAPVSLSGAQPVLSDEQFTARTQDLAKLLSK